MNKDKFTMQHMANRGIIVSGFRHEEPVKLTKLMWLAEIAATTKLAENYISAGMVKIDGVAIKDKHVKMTGPRVFDVQFEQSVTRVEIL